LLNYGSDYRIHGQNATIPGPSLKDPNLKVELIARGLNFPTAIDFLGNDDFLVLEKNTGNVYRITLLRL
jgi:glucose/arabinose dehydrogenase